jgi:hypothetical protein
MVIRIDAWYQRSSEGVWLKVKLAFFFNFKDLKCKIHEKTTRRTPALLSQCHFILQNQ